MKNKGETAMEFKLDRMSNPSKKKIIEDICRVDKIVNKSIITVKDYQEHSQVSHGTLRKYLGSWHEALCAAGLEHKSNRKTKTKKLTEQAGKYLTDDEIIDELKRVAKKLNQPTVTTTELDQNSKIISASTVRNRFGWSRGLKLANLGVKSLGKRYSDEECFENLVNVWMHYGRQPKSNEMKVSPSAVGPKAYTRRWGSWLKALEAFIKEINSDIDRNDKDIVSVPRPKKAFNKPTVKAEDKREISYRLRYQVLSRDNFCCAICGNSPAKDRTCELHIDHIYPFSKGGKTVFDNLRTLCKKCNLGKGDLIENLTEQKDTLDQK